MRFSYNSTVHNTKENVWDFIMTFEQRPSWIHFIEKCTLTDKKEGWVGTKYQEKSLFLGIPLNVTYEVTAYKEGELCSSICRMKPFYPEVFITMKDNGDGTIFSQLDFEIKIGVLGFIPKRIIKKQVDKLVNPCINKYIEILDNK